MRFYYFFVLPLSICFSINLFAQDKNLSIEKIILLENSSTTSHKKKYDIPLVEHPTVDYYIHFFSNKGRVFFKKWIVRYDRYQKVIQKILKKQNVPIDAIGLAMIESGFIASANSSASAVGFWQFIPSTGKEYKLKQNKWIDERRDIFKSTLSAAKYLNNLYQEFSDWHLAFAAYNAGRGRIKRALQKYNESDYWNLIKHKNSIATETMHYVPKIIASMVIVKNREKYGFAKTLNKKTLPEDFDTLKINKMIRLNDIADAFNIPIHILQELNYALIYGITPPHNSYLLRVPKTYGKKVSYWVKNKKTPKNISYIPYITKKNDHLSKIAKQFKTPIQKIITFNSILYPYHLRLGQKLVIPQIISNKKRKYRIKHRVIKGDTLWSIAKKYRTTIQKIKYWNNRRNNDLFVGEYIKIL